MIVVGGDKDFKFGRKVYRVTPSPRTTNHQWKGRGKVTWTN